MEFENADSASGIFDSLLEGNDDELIISKRYYIHTNSNSRKYETHFKLGSCREVYIGAKVVSATFGVDDYRLDLRKKISLQKRYFYTILMN